MKNYQTIKGRTDSVNPELNILWHNGTKPISNYISHFSIIGKGVHGHPCGGHPQPEHAAVHHTGTEQ